ncbi:MAG TPA: T9SS type A sorting domain-containing protein [Puia sp.]|jgi:hypothetical protein
MKNLYSNIVFSLLAALLLSSQASTAQSCSTAAGDQTTYGTNGTWIGYVYQGRNFDTYFGYVNEGSAASPNFDESFGGAGTNYNTNGCAIYTDNFSVRYKLTQVFASGNYSITVGGDDGYRLSLDGGATWTINQWNDQSYNTTNITIALNGSYNIIFEYYENGGDNRVSFNVTPICTGTGDPTIYGTGTTWMGYIYQGMNFDQYKGSVTEGLTFDENFGNSGASNTATYNTSSCSITTYQFSARYRLQQNLTPAHYLFTVGGDDGYRLSLDGGATWVINNWGDHSYAVSSYDVVLSGTYNMVLEYYDDGGGDEISFAMTSTLLPVSLTGWSVSAVPGNPDQALLKWQATNAVNFDHYIIQRSNDGQSFQDIHTTPGVTGTGTTTQEYSYTDQYAFNGTVFYRLEMIDRDGTFTYSNIVSIGFQSSQDIRIYPTRVEDGSLFVESALSIHQARLEIFDMNGRRIQAKDWTVLDGRQSVSINGNKGSLPAGAYIARLSNSNSILAKQIIIVK